MGMIHIHHSHLVNLGCSIYETPLPIVRGVSDHHQIITLCKRFTANHRFEFSA